MDTRVRGWIAACILGLVSVSGAQTTLPAQQFVFRSNGAAWGNDYNLWGFGYLGTFLSLQKATAVTLKVRASGQSALNVWPQMGVHVGNRQFLFTVSSTNFLTYSATVNLPAGLSGLRIEFLNDFYGSGQDRNLIVRDLTVSAQPNSGLQVVNPTDTPTLVSTVYATADNNIENYRKQTAKVMVFDSMGKALPAGTSIRFKLKRHAFNFGTAVAGVGNPGEPMWPNPAVGSDAANYQSAVVTNFNSLEEENAGKWEFTEPVRWQPTMQYTDAILSFASRHGMHVRHHNLLWGVEQPDWAIALENAAQSSDPKAAAVAKADLSKAISFRRDYTVRERSTRYQELDCINEASSGHQPVFLNIYGYGGIAKIYNDAVNSVRQAGSSANVYFNDYGVLNGNSDLYGGWYLEFMRGVMTSGITEANQSRLGVGIQYYNIGSFDHDPVRIYMTLQNLGTLGLPMTLSEFGVDSGLGAQAAQLILEDTLRLVFGSDQCTTFNVWGFWSPMMWVNGAAFFDQNWNIMPCGMIWQQMTGLANWNLANVPNWSTDITLTTDSTGSVNFRGFAGDYALTSGSKAGTMKLTVGTLSYKASIH